MSSDKNIQHNITGFEENKVPWDSINNLKAQDLSRDEIYNIWYDKMATAAWDKGLHNSNTPDVSPYEKWAIYISSPTYHKLIGNLTSGLPEALSYYDTLSFISKKHSMSMAVLNNINHTALK